MIRSASLLLLGSVAAVSAVAADPTSGVDGALFRSSYDAGGVFAVEGARLMPRRDLSLKLLVGYARSPLDLVMPGIGDGGADPILDHVLTLDLAFGMTLTERLAIGFNVGGYRTSTGEGYGARGRYASGGLVSMKSTGLIALRPLSNIDPSASPSDEAAYLGDGLAGPLDAHAGLKYALIVGPHLAVTAIGSILLPFGEDEMLLGERDLVFEPMIAADWRKDDVHATRLVANLGARIRRRSVIESYDAADPMATEADAQVVLDVGSELVAGLGAVYELVPRAFIAAEAQVFVPLPAAVDWGSCRRFNGERCSAIDGDDYFAEARRGDLTVLATLGAMVRVSADVTATLMVGTGQGGARGEDVRITTGLSWAPQIAGAAAPGRSDRDGDRVPDAIDGCPEEPEDDDGYQDEDGCPDLDNDGDGITDADDQCPEEPEDRDGFEDTDGCPELDNDGDGNPDATDRCPDQPEDIDGFEDEDGCLDQDNDGDGIADADDRCPNDAEVVNGVDDEDGCPDARGTAGPEERADRIDLKGAQVSFLRGGAALTAPAKLLLTQVATLIKNGKLTIRVEVHVPRSTRATRGAAVTAAKRRDKLLSQRRAKAILDFLGSQGVPGPQLQAVGLGSDRPLGTAAPSDPGNERVDFIKAQQGRTP